MVYHGAVFTFHQFKVIAKDLVTEDISCDVTPTGSSILGSVLALNQKNLESRKISRDVAPLVVCLPHMPAAWVPSPA